MAKLKFRRLDDHSPMFWALMALHVVVVALGPRRRALHGEHGHVVTGMNNQIVWGMPHVFAVFLIVAASGALNVASVSSVFNRLAYKPYARLSGVLAIALLVGGLAVLVLDLGRPERLIVAMTTYNFKSIFAWNIYLYTGFVADRRRLSVLDDGPPRLEIRGARQDHRLARLRLASGADHRHRLDLRLPGRPRGLRRGDHGAAVHRRLVPLRARLHGARAR